MHNLLVFKIFLLTSCCWKGSNEGVYWSHRSSKDPAWVLLVKSNSSLQNFGLITSNLEFGKRAIYFFFLLRAYLDCVFLSPYKLKHYAKSDWVTFVSQKPQTFNCEKRANNKSVRESILFHQQSFDSIFFTTKLKTIPTEAVLPKPQKENRHKDVKFLAMGTYTSSQCIL